VTDFSSTGKQTLTVSKQSASCQWPNLGETFLNAEKIFDRQNFRPANFKRRKNLQTPQKKFFFERRLFLLLSNINNNNSRAQLFQSADRALAERDFTDHASLNDQHTSMAKNRSKLARFGGIRTGSHLFQLQTWPLLFRSRDCRNFTYDRAMVRS
jgi:hypothetical protein